MSDSGAGVPSEVAVASQDPASRVGKYVKVKHLGSGGMGEVWKAWDTDLTRWVALKFLRQTQPEEVARFRREAQMSAKLSHPNIAAVYEARDDYIAMQYVDGETLEAHAKGDVRALVGAMRQAAIAVHYAHEQGVIHRDLKPANIMVESRESRVYVMDFGLARSMDVPSALSVTGAVVGTPGYMSPEQAQGSRRLDARADVYALGATLYALLAGRPPFGGSNVYEVVRKIIEDDPSSIRAINRRVDEDLETIVMKCLEKEPARRYRTALELAEELRHWAQGEPISARPMSRAERLRRAFRRHRAAFLSLAAIVLVLAGSGALLFVQGSRARAKESALKQLAVWSSAIGDHNRELRQLRVPLPQAKRELSEAVAAVDRYVRDWPDEPQGYHVRARGRLYLNVLDGAERDVRAALDRHPGFRPGWSLLGIIKLERFRRALISTNEPDVTETTRFAPLLVAAADAFARGYEPGREPEEAARWGLAWSRDDAVLQRLAAAMLVWYRDGRRDEAKRMVQAAADEYQSEELACVLATLTTDRAARLRLLEDALRLAPGYAMAHVLLGLVCQGSRDMRRRAVAEFDRAMEIEGQSAAMLAFRAMARHVLREDAGAREDAERALALDAECVRALVVRGSVRCDVDHDLDGAEADFDRALALEPDYYVALTDRGVVKKERGQLEAAVADFDRVLAAREDDAGALLRRAEVRILQGRVKEAIADYDRAIAVDPAAPVYAARANAKRQIGDGAGAMADAERAVELDPQEAQGWYIRGALRRDRHDLRGALEDGNRAVQLMPESASAHVERGATRAAAGDADGALEDYARAIVLDPRCAEAYNDRGVLLLRAQKYEEAFRAFDEAVKCAPRNAGAIANRGVVRAMREEWVEAERDLAEALRVAGPEWGSRAEAERVLAGVREHLKRQ